VKTYIYINKNGQQTKIMPITKKNRPYQQVFSRENEIETVHNFIYLGSDIDGNGSCVSKSAEVYRSCNEYSVNQSSKDMT